MSRNSPPPESNAGETGFELLSDEEMNLSSDENSDEDIQILMDSTHVTTLQWPINAARGPERTISDASEGPAQTSSEFQGPATRVSEVVGSDTVPPHPDATELAGGGIAAALTRDLFGDEDRSSRGSTPTPNDVNAGADVEDEIERDLARSITGLYRILDLVSERGSGGLVDKVIIAQDSLAALVNDLSPGAYRSLTKLDFLVLDKILIKPIGVYGSQEEIVEFLIAMGAVDTQTAQLLKDSGGGDDTAVKPFLRSGIYVLHSSTEDGAETLYVIYWPERTTWEDKAISSVRRNRVTFMRYLTKISDHLIALVSEDHLEVIKRADNSDTEYPLDIMDDDDRLFSFEVEKTNEQQESVVTREGFSFVSPLISAGNFPEPHGLDPKLFEPRLVSGETKQGIMSTEFIPGSMVNKRHNDVMNRFRLEHTLRGHTLRLAQDLDENAVFAIMINGEARSRYGLAFKTWKERSLAIKQKCEDSTKYGEKDLVQRLSQDGAKLEKVVQDRLFRQVVEYYPQFTLEGLGFTADKSFGCKAYWDEVIALYPDITPRIATIISEANLTKVAPKGDPFRLLKSRLISIFVFLQHIPLEETDRISLMKELFKHEDLQRADHLIRGPSSNLKPTAWTKLLKRLLPSSRDDRQKLTEANRIAQKSAPPQFLSSLPRIAELDPVQLAPLCTKAFEALQASLKDAVQQLAPRIISIIEGIQDSVGREQNQAAAQQVAIEERKMSLLQLIDGMRARDEQGRTLDTITIEAFQVLKNRGSREDSFRIQGSTSRPQPSSIKYTIHQLEYSTDDHHRLQFDPDHIPTPLLEGRRSHTFHLPTHHIIIHSQLLESDKLLLAVDERDGKIHIYCETMANMDGALQRKTGKPLDRAKIGDRFIFAFDEMKRTVAICTSAKLQLHILAFDETYGSLQGAGSTIDLAPWYHEEVVIEQSCFVPGREEILLLDSKGNARIFSLITQQFRPAFVRMDHRPKSMASTPDGSCLLVAFEDVSQPIRAYHWASFGSAEGVPLELCSGEPSRLFPTSLIKRGNVHLLFMDPEQHLCHSVALVILSRVTEYLFKEQLGDRRVNSDDSGPSQASLIDCHSEVWTRFPVDAAVQRRVGNSPPSSKSLIFVTRSIWGGFERHFSDLILRFEQKAKKPTGNELSTICVSELLFSSFTQDLPNLHTSAKPLHTGEWLMHVLCLIPIHLAVARENRFIPLKDGVSSASLEKNLLGAEVSQIVESLSVGWYESIFQSYMATKPVKVVSSMGEQSVGKSYSLNHMVDTSFSGSAMRTTEGVWMSVTPTEDALLVALDFEGVHSIERSTQEDMLLVLFNTAISNLVLFRNNFALSRDISDLFHSFQFSATVLDPAANPSLFQSKLIIIIKDVVESDTREIKKEFSLKFQKIVEDQQADNFITKLHAGKLGIIPWPVIETRQFYGLFATLKKQLDLQPITHPAAGEFLLTLKTLMAKLKTNDWGALDQTLAAHRAQRLLQLLPCALETGYSALEPVLEPLKNFDTDSTLDIADSYCQFVLTNEETTGRMKEAALNALNQSFPATRQVSVDANWLSDLVQHIDDLLNVRVLRVKEWIDSNLSRFKATHANIEELGRNLEDFIVDLKANVQICGGPCQACHLLCLRPRLHDGDHDCTTSHKCQHTCNFCEIDSENRIDCGYSAGHPGPHICDVTEHLCGKVCKLSGKPGCLEKCTNVFGHTDEDHKCGAPNHTCGELCALARSLLPGGSKFACTRVCDYPSDQEHTQHACSSSACPFSCVLCKRLCASSHLHGVDSSAVHLCREEHVCKAPCQDGVCEIDTAPHSIAATFTGRHETFEYTQYAQVAKRLPCAKPIMAGRTDHDGPHVHSLEVNPFHFCESRCNGCGYYCTLPLGHSEQEHETRHGSMSETQWAVEGDSDTILEINGKRFASNDEGAPMMCNLVCQAMGRHVHVDFCRAKGEQRCAGDTDVQHCPTAILPHPEKPKDWITHNLYWRRSGFKDPYPRTTDEKSDFTKCDAMCPGSEHTGRVNAQPSFCTLPHFHPPATASQRPSGELGYVSIDGHSFRCKNPVGKQPSFHVIFVIDKSGSMRGSDLTPLADTPITKKIKQSHSNRLGAVFSSLYTFWTTHQPPRSSGATRRDAYSVIFFADEATTTTAVVNDFNRTPEQLLTALLTHKARQETNFNAGLKAAQKVMVQNWSNERPPVVVFLSDGGSPGMKDQSIYDLAQAAIDRGKPLSLHTVLFGPDKSSPSLRHMAKVAKDYQTRKTRDSSFSCSFSEALDTVKLAETFRGLAESLRKPRGSLL